MNTGTLDSAELYDPSTGIWTRTGSLNYARCYHTASVLLNEKVLVAGGTADKNIESAELYDPSTGIWTITGTINTV